MSFPLVLDIAPYALSTQGYSIEICGAVGKASVQSAGHAEVLQKFLWPKRYFQMQNNIEFDTSRVPSSTDGSSSDDTHLSGSEDLASDTSSESMTGRLGDEIVGKHEVSELPRCDDCINPTGYRDVKMYGLDNILFSSLGQNLVPLDDREQLLRRFQELGDGASFLEPCSQMAYNPLLNFPMPQSRSGKFSTAMASASAQSKNKVSYELTQDGAYNSGRWLYELISVVVHHGSPRNGHYTVYRKAKLKINHSTETEHKSDMLQDILRDDVSNLDGCKSDAMVTDTWNSGGCDEEMKYVSVDSSLESLSANVSNGPACTTWNDNGGEIKDVIPAEIFPGPREKLPSKDVNCNDPSALPSVDSDKNFEVKEGAHIDAPGNPQSKQFGQGEIVLWFRVSDSHVDLVTEEEVMMAQATLLFYERSIDMRIQNSDKLQHLNSQS